MLLSLSDKAGRVKTRYYDLDFNGSWDFMEKYDEEIESLQKFLWWQERWQEVTAPVEATADCEGQRILVDGKNVPMKWENGAWIERNRNMDWRWTELGTEVLAFLRGSSHSVFFIFVSTKDVKARFPMDGKMPRIISGPHYGRCAESERTA